VGLSERILIHHVLRNSYPGCWPDFAAVIGGGAILTETVFNCRGGAYAANSIRG
jgi:ABC-type dipeptide/oligopeptide/nickel transport system permease component